MGECGYSAPVAGLGTSASWAAVLKPASFCLPARPFVRITPWLSMMLTFYSLPWSPTPGAPLSGNEMAMHSAPRRRVLSARACVCLWIGLLSLVRFTSPVAAQQQPAANKTQTSSTVLLATSGGHASARALDSVISAALDDLKVVNVVARPGLDLGAVQLALDCVAETPQCLRIVTTQHEADVLVAPTLARIANELVLTLLRFDARTGKTQRVLKRQPGQTLSSDTLDAVPALLRELFELPPEEAAPPPAAKPEPKPDLMPSDGISPTLSEPLPEPPMEAPSEGRKFPVGPLLLGGGGVILIGAGLIMGLTVMSAEDSFDEAAARVKGISDPVEAQAAVDRANGFRDTGEANAVISNVFLGLGSAVVVASGIWLAVELTSRSRHDDQQVKLSPMIGRHELGLVLTHSGAGL